MQIKQENPLSTFKAFLQTIPDFPNTVLVFKVEKNCESIAVSEFSKCLLKNNFDQILSKHAINENVM